MSAVALPNLAGGGDALAGGSGRGLPPGWVAGQGLAAPAAAGGRRGTAELFTRNAPLVSAFCRYELGDAASSSAIVLL